MEFAQGPPAEPRLADAVLSAWRTATGTGDGSAPRDLVAARVMVAEARALLIDALDADASTAGSALVQLNELAGQAQEALIAHRLKSFTLVHAAIGRMRAVTATRQLMAVAPAELCRCGFDRAMLTRVEGSTGYPEAFHVEGDKVAALAFLNAGKGDPMSLDHMLLETEMLRRRAPVLVPDAQTDPRVHKTLSEITRTSSYVAAPIMAEGRVIGFFHADCFVTQRDVDDFDRDLLWMFAEGFGAAYERAALIERMAVLRNEVRRLNANILTVMDEAVDSEVEVERMASADRSVAHSAAAMFVAADSRLESLLTPREMDVIKLMATGQTNGGIATRLVVSEGTVKSHVKHILRKLRASNRAEAVSRYIKLSQQSAQRAPFD